MQEKIRQHLGRDARLRDVIRTTEPVAPNGEGDLYAGLLRSILSQQLSGKAAATIHGRFLDLFPGRYPDPGRLLALDTGQLRAAGLSRAKAGYVQNVAAFFLAENLLERDWSQDRDEEVLRILTRIKGVGQWTVEMILMFSLQRPDVLPLDDLGIRNAMIRLYGVQEEGRRLKPRLEAIAEPWRPYRSHACFYLWPWYHTNAG